VKRKILIVVIWSVLLGLAALVPTGCSMAKPVSIVVDDGALEVQGVGRVSGKHIRYRSGLLEAGEAGVTFDGKASGFPASGPAPADPPPPPK
jgi:hypothetical protein